MSTPQIAVLGFAHGHVNAYCQRWADDPAGTVQLVAGWDHDPARRQTASGHHGVPVTEDVDALLARSDIDGVVIGAETSLHAELAEKAAAAGKAIVLQKPLALTMAEADRIVDAVESAGVPFSMAWQMRVDPQNREIKRLMESGAIGRVLRVRRRHGLSTQFMNNFTDTWHVKPELNRGMWADDAAHAIDFILWLMGRPKTVMAEIDTLLDPRVPDDNGMAIFRYEDGRFAEVSCSFTCPAGENTVEVIGDRGVIIQNFGDAPSANGPRPNGAIGLKWIAHGDDAWTVSPIASPPKHGDRIAGLAEPLAAFLRGEAPAIATADEGRTALHMTLACHESSDAGRRIDL